MLDLKVPNVNERDRIPEEAIRAVVEHIARHFDPEKIILFGSYAYGDPKPWSDMDLLVVMEAPEGELPMMLAIYRSMSPIPFGMDILVRSQATIDYRIPLGDWFLKEITQQGKVVYERGQR
jgi:predicted nucleotidyltransferase